MMQKYFENCFRNVTMSISGSILIPSRRLLFSTRRCFSVDAVLASALAATCAGIVTFFLKHQQTTQLRHQLQFHQFRLRELEEQVSKAKTTEETLKGTVEELSKRTLETAELRSSCEKFGSSLTLETNSRLKAEEETARAKERIQRLESDLSDLNYKYVQETRLLSECKGRLESVHAAVRVAKEQVESEKEARTNLEKTIETSLKINIERIREDLVSKTREVVGAGVVETLKSSLRQTPVLGRFGEIQLAYLLREYFTLGELKLYDEQVTLESKKRLDAVLKLPLEKGVLHIIIDAKTPNIFQMDSNSGDFSVTVNHLRNRLAEVLTALSKAEYVEYYRRHLASRSSSINNENTGNHHHSVCDFVLMFLPMDYALLAVDQQLLRKCLDAKVIVCTPSLLGLQVEFIKMAWRQKLPSDALQHAEHDFSTLTDSLQVLTKDLDRCGSSLKMATTRAEKASNRLKNSVASVFSKSVTSS